MKSNKAITWGLFFIASFFLFAAALSGCSSSDKSESEELTPVYTEAIAYRCAKAYTRTKLKAPTTAVFPSIYDAVMEEQVIQMDSITFLIDSNVSSQNSFGAMLKIPFSCIVKFPGDDKVTICNFKFKKFRRNVERL